MRILCLIVLCCLCFGCNDDETLNDVIFFDKEFEISTNQEVILADGILHVKVIEVQDSRCPESVDCIWPGEVKIDLKVKAHEEIDTLQFVLRSETVSKKFSQYEVKLFDVTPYPKIDVEVFTHKVRLKVNKD